MIGFSLGTIAAVAAVVALVLLALKLAAVLLEGTLDARTPEQQEAESRSLFVAHALIWAAIVAVATVALAWRARSGSEAPEQPTRGSLRERWTLLVGAIHSSVPRSLASLRRRLTAGAPVGAAYLVLALVMMWPATLRLGSIYVGEKDASYYIWLMWRVGRLMGSGEIWALRIPDVVWPLGVDLRLSDGLLPTLIGGAWNLVAGPVLAYNLGLLTATLLNLWAAGRLARVFTDSRLVRVVVAASFAMAPSIVLRMPVHFTMYFAFAVPLLLERAVRVYRADEPVRPLVTGFLLWLAYLCGVYYLIFGGLAYLLVVTAGLLRRRAWLKSLPHLAVTGLVALVLMGPFLLPRLELDRAERAAGGSPVLTSHTDRAGADATSLFVQPPGSTFELPWMEDLREGFRANRHEATIFPGWLLLAALGAVLVTRLRPAAPILVTTVALWILSMGGTLKLSGDVALTYPGGDPVLWMPWPALLELPGLASLRAGNRTSFTIAATLAVALAVVLGHLFARWRGGGARAAIALVCGITLLTNLLIPMPTDALPSNRSLTSALTEMNDRREPGDSALLVPADCNSRTLWTVKLQIVHRTPLLGCQASPSQLPWYSGLDAYAESDALAALRCRQGRLARRSTGFSEEVLDPDDFRDLRSDLGVRFLIVDRFLLAHDPSCARLAAEVPVIMARLETLGRSGRWVVLDTQE